MSIVSQRPCKLLGQLVRRQLAKQIEPVKREHSRLKRPPAEIEARAREILQPLNNGSYTPEATQTLNQFVERVYFPILETQKRASTAKRLQSALEFTTQAAVWGTPFA